MHPQNLAPQSIHAGTVETRGQYRRRLVHAFLAGIGLRTGLQSQHGGSVPREHQLSGGRRKYECYYIKDEANIPDDHYLMVHAEIYLKARHFDQQEFWQWVQSYFVLKGFQWADKEAATITDFAETNAIMRMFSLENVKKMESKLGKEWWKKK